MIDWKYQKFEIKININSSQDISNDNIEIYVNDKQYIYSGSKMDEVNLVSNKKKNAFYFNADLLLTPGINRIYAKVKKNGAEDRTDEIKINYNQRDKGILHIVSIGIIDSKNSLKYTRKDAEDFADLFKKQQGKIYSEVRTTVLTNPSETRKDEITNAISELNLMAKQERIAKEDAVILFISTHGFMGDSTQDLRLKMSNYNPANEENTSISYEKDIQNKIADLPCKKYIFLDACQSGGAIKAYRGKKDDDDAFEKIYQNAIDKIKNNNNNLRIVASCAPTQKSYESPIWENGAFTFAIKKMLQNRTICEQYDNTNGKKDGVITLSELYQYLVKEVPDLVKSVYKAEQTPIMPNNQKNEELPLFAY
jgi:hypothetical protein